MANKRRSAQDIRNHATRLVNRLALESYKKSFDENGKFVPNVNTTRRMERIGKIADRYVMNIAKSQGNPNGYVSNTDYTKKVSRRVYMGLSAG